jgi:hypothetical protein
MTAVLGVQPFPMARERGGHIREAQAKLFALYHELLKLVFQ